MDVPLHMCTPKMVAVLRLWRFGNARTTIGTPITPVSMRAQDRLQNFFNNHKPKAFRRMRSARSADANHAGSSDSGGAGAGAAAVGMDANANPNPL